jgi:pimeloyl-ACP methyl ester carboxylesterase
VESWYRNIDAWRRHFEVFQPNLIAYEGASLHRRIEEKKPIDVDYLTGRLYEYLDGFVQLPPYRLVANSVGGKVAVEFTARHPQLVERLVLLSPSGLGAEERMPVLEGVRRHDMQAVVESVFSDPRQADLAILEYYQEQLSSRRWRLGVLRTIRGTTGYAVRDRLRDVTRPTLLVVGMQDRVVDPHETIDAARLLPHGSVVTLEGCGHAPQVEQADTVNTLVLDFLSGRSPQAVGGASSPPDVSRRPA